MATRKPKPVRARGTTFPRSGVWVEGRHFDIAAHAGFFAARMAEETQRGVEMRLCLFPGASIRACTFFPVDSVDAMCGRPMFGGVAV
jgi:hypothetical protein